MTATPKQTFEEALAAVGATWEAVTPTVQRNGGRGGLAGVLDAPLGHVWVANGRHVYAVDKTVARDGWVDLAAVLAEGTAECPRAECPICAAFAAHAKFVADALKARGKEKVS